MARDLRPLMIVPEFDRTGGYERQAFFLARTFSRAGVASLIVTNNPWGHAQRELRDGVVIHRIDPLPRKRDSWPNIYKAFLLFLLSHRDEYDVIHCHAFTFLSGLCVALGKLLGKPVLVKVATEQDVRTMHTSRAPLTRLFYRLLRRADRLLALSTAIRDEFHACGLDERRVALVPNGVDTEWFAPATSTAKAVARQRWNLADDATVFAFTGRLVQRKGVDLLLRALAASPKLRTTTTLVVGDGPQRATLEAQARSARLDVRFLGDVDDVRSALTAADAFVFPSRLEGLPNALLEAMSMRLPVIATRIGGCTDVLGDGSGLLVEPNDTRELTNTLDQIASDPALRRRYATLARHRAVSTFAFDRVAERLQSEYHGVLRA